MTSGTKGTRKELLRRKLLKHESVQKLIAEPISSNTQSRYHVCTCIHFFELANLRQEPDKIRSESASTLKAINKHFNQINSHTYIRSCKRFTDIFLKQRSLAQPTKTWSKTTKQRCSKNLLFPMGKTAFAVKFFPWHGTWFSYWIEAMGKTLFIVRKITSEEVIQSSVFSYFEQVFTHSQRANTCSKSAK